jgi:hypothetical protein
MCAIVRLDEATQRHVCDDDGRPGKNQFDKNQSFTVSGRAASAISGAESSPFRIADVAR